MMPLIALFMASLIGFLIFSVDNYVTTTDVPYVVLSPEAPTRTAANLLATTLFDTTMPEVVQGTS